MKSLLLCVLLLVFPARSSSRLFAADDLFAIELSVQAGTRQQSVRGGSTAAAAKNTAPLVFAVKTKARLRVRWSVVSRETTGSIRDVTVHVVLDKGSTLGQPGVPKPSPDVVYESALITDFGARRKSTGDFVLEAPEPGDYLLQVRTIGRVTASHEEYFAAMDVRVVP